MSKPSDHGILGKGDPRALGDYEIVRRIATGGMAEVYLARHGKIAGLKTLVVVKRVLPHLARDEHFLNMFLDEARIVASLDHPNVVRIIEVGVEEDEYFLAMELVQGETLARLLGELHRTNRRLDPRLGAFIVAQAAAGLHHAHTLHDGDGQLLHVVHRDVSPENILLSFEGAVKVIDFGVARALGRVNQTLQGGPKGKAGYMAPEQARGEVVDQRADIFALGVVLWEVLTGRRLFRRDNDFASLRAIIEEPAPRLAEVAPDAVALEAVLDRALAKDPAQRLASAGELAAVLESFVARTEGGKLGSAELATFMKEAMPAHREAWRELTRSAMTLGTRPTELPLVRPARDGDDDDLEEFLGADTVRESRSSVVGLASAALAETAVPVAASPEPPADAIPASTGPSSRRLPTVPSADAVTASAGPSSRRLPTVPGVDAGSSPTGPSSQRLPTVAPPVTASRLATLAASAEPTPRKNLRPLLWLLAGVALGLSAVLVYGLLSGREPAPPVAAPAPRPPAEAPAAAAPVVVEDPLPPPAPTPEPPPEPTSTAPKPTTNVAPKPVARPKTVRRSSKPAKPRESGKGAPDFKPNPFD